LLLAALGLVGIIVLTYVYVGAEQMAAAQASITRDLRLIDALAPLLPSAISVIGSTPIYYINMAKSKERRARIEDSAARAGLLQQLHRIEGFDASGIVSTHGHSRVTLHDDLEVCTPDDDICILVPKSYSGTFNVGELGCLVSHLLAIRQALANGHDLVLVAEDDVILEPIALWPTTLAELLARAPAGWGAVNLMPTPLRTVIDSDSDVPLYVPPRAADGRIPPPTEGFDDHLHASMVFYAIRRSGMEAVWGSPPTRRLVLRERLWRLLSDAHIWTIVPTYHFTQFSTVLVPNVGAVTPSVINGTPSRRWARTSALAHRAVATAAVAAARQALAQLPRGLPHCIHRTGVECNLKDLVDTLVQEEPTDVARLCTPQAHWTWIDESDANYDTPVLPSSCGPYDLCAELKGLSALDAHGGVMTRTLQALNQLRTSEQDDQSHFAIVLEPPAIPGDASAQWSLVAATPGHPLLMAIERYQGGPFADPAEPQTLVQAVRALLDMTDGHPAPGVMLCRAEKDCHLGR
jgi:hypothetical protein